MSPVDTVGFELAPWQLDAVAAWERGGDRPFTGTLEIFTGGGKTLIALQCFAEATRRTEDLRLAVVVPTEALVHQWVEVIRRHTDVPEHQIGRLGAGGKDDFTSHRVVVAVLNTASKRLPELARNAQPIMLVVDECHRAGAATFSKVLDTPAEYRLGLSATPEREEFDDDGEPLRFDEQVVGRKLGPVVHRFTLRDARRIGWLPVYELNHHGLALHPTERERYDAVSRRVDELADQLRNLGADTSRAQSLRGRNDELGQVAQSYVAVTSQRKDLLYRADERTRVAIRLVMDALLAGSRRILIFHERVDEATQLHDAIREALGDRPEQTTMLDAPAARQVGLFPDASVGIRLEHSHLPDSVRAAAIGDFRSGRAAVLVSVKSLIEGIDVPEAEVGISVASSSSVRQRVQALGRVLRRQFDDDAPVKHAEMHLLYMADTVDDLIYAKEDWGDLTGEGANRYWRWPLDPALAPEPRDGPPRTPRPTEEQEWVRLGERPPEQPVPWLGVLVGQEYSVDTTGTVTNSSGAVMSNPQDTAAMVAAVRGRPGGRFRVTPMHRLVLVANRAAGGSEVLVAGALAEPFRTLDEVAESGGEPADLNDLCPGDPYSGPSDKSGGTYKLRQRDGGVIERKGPGRSSEFALTDSPGTTEQLANARRLLDAWRGVSGQGMTFHVNELGHAWYNGGSERRFLAAVPEGFAWPGDEEEEGTS